MHITHEDGFVYLNCPSLGIKTTIGPIWIDLLSYPRKDTSNTLLERMGITDPSGKFMACLCTDDWTLTARDNKVVIDIGKYVYNISESNAAQLLADICEAFPVINIQFI